LQRKLGLEFAALADGMKSAPPLPAALANWKPANAQDSSTLSNIEAISSVSLEGLSLIALMMPTTFCAN
jgi:hypothetical protein